jgi:aryl-alcohol dehydrogenase-like predicted oxidoreductase
MNYRRLGRTGLKVSEISLGGWLTYGHQIDEEQSIPIIHRAFELGINLFDSADVYAAGRSEEVMGKALKDFKREEVVIATKVRGRIFEGVNGEGLSRKHIMEACHASLRRLGTEYIDLYQVHWYDTETPLEETMEALNDLVRQGKVLYIGCSNFSADQLQDAIGISEKNKWARFDSIQPHYNIVSRDIEKELMPRCGQKGVGMIVYCPLAQGILTGKYLSEKKNADTARKTDTQYFKGKLTSQKIESLRELEKLAKKKRKTMAQLALGWILSKKEITSCIVGARTVKQIEENAKGSGIKLSEKELQDLDKWFPQNAQGNF